MSTEVHSSSLVCRWAFRAFALAYGAALAIYCIAELGLLGQPRDPLGGVFLVPLGLPWNRLVARAPEALWPWLAAAAPALNLLLIAGACSLWERKRRSVRGPDADRTLPG